jgi:hypothetical protein
MSETTKRTLKMEMRITEEEKRLIETMFADDDLLKALRKGMYGVELTPKERSFLVTSFSTENMVSLLRKMFIPTLVGDEPVGQVVDLFYTIDEQNLPDERAIDTVNARKRAISVMEHNIKAISGAGEYVPALRGDINSWEDLHYRNFYVRNVEGVLMQFKILAMNAPKTPEEIEKKRQADSTK